MAAILLEHSSGSRPSRVAVLAAIERVVADFTGRPSRSRKGATRDGHLLEHAASPSASLNEWDATCYSCKGGIDSAFLDMESICHLGLKCPAVGGLSVRDSAGGLRWMRTGLQCEMYTRIWWCGQSSSDSFHHLGSFVGIRSRLVRGINHSAEPNGLSPTT